MVLTGDSRPWVLSYSESGDSPRLRSNGRLRIGYDALGLSMTIHI